ncbi:MAG: hypothetical protein HY344_00590 [Candidatus Levybacteria bacterium]|nr:hypothetical protein [Candidatus Levybacteria bacterium]
MIPRTELQLEHVGMEVDTYQTIAVFKSDWARNPQDVITAKDKLKRDFHPSTLRIRQDAEVTETPDEIVFHPILVWTATWIHGYTPIVPNLVDLHEDYLFHYNLPAL